MRSRLRPWVVLLLGLPLAWYLGSQSANLVAAVGHLLSPLPRASDVVGMSVHRADPEGRLVIRDFAVRPEDFAEVLGALEPLEKERGPYRSFPLVELTITDRRGRRTSVLVCDRSGRPPYLLVSGPWVDGYWSGGSSKAVIAAVEAAYARATSKQYIRDS